jgi:hypothetical protein
MDLPGIIIFQHIQQYEIFHNLLVIIRPIAGNCIIRIVPGYGANDLK